jgi:CelD/BcsL family acetyltransferase involved in cellulose biosynthesis
VADPVFPGEQVKEPAPQARRIKASSYTREDWLRIAPPWSELAARSPYSSFFLSAEWVSAWLEAFGASLPHEILVFEDEGGVVVGACLIVHSLERRGPFSVKRIYLNTGGGDPAERPMMELNNLLCCPGWELEIAEAIGARLRSLQWDEFAVESICPGPVLMWLQTEFAPKLASIVVRRSSYVDLARLRRFHISFDTSLSPNTRQQLRRSMRLYQSLGAIRVEVAQTLSRAEEFFDEMCRIHQATWRRRGERGAFASPRTVLFHRTLIRLAFARGAIQMLKVSAGEETVGILYNFVENGKVSFYQSGFNYKQHKHLKPGLVTHACAIQECLARGFDDYDFLAGEARYKQCLAKDSRPLFWVVCAKPSVKMALIEFLRDIRRRVRKAHQRILNMPQRRRNWATR